MTGLSLVLSVVPHARFLTPDNYLYYTCLRDPRRWGVRERTGLGRDPRRVVGRERGERKGGRYVTTRMTPA